jgi:hypothetical protein
MTEGDQSFADSLPGVLLPDQRVVELLLVDVALLEQNFAKFLTHDGTNPFLVRRPDGSLDGWLERAAGKPPGVDKNRMRPEHRSSSRLRPHACEL